MIITINIYKVVSNMSSFDVCGNNKGDGENNDKKIEQKNKMS